MPTDGDAVAVATASTAVVVYNRNRRYLLIENISDTPVYLMIDGTAVTTSGLLLPANGGFYEMTEALGNLDRRLINAIHAGTGNKTVTVTEYP